MMNWRNNFTATQNTAQWSDLIYKAVDNSKQQNE